SGARSAVVAFLIGMGVIVWFRRLPANLIFLGVACGVGLYLGALVTEGGILDRLATVDPKSLWTRFYIVWKPGTRDLLQGGFLGGGLGKAAVGFPMSLADYIGRFPVWGVDGDLGKTMAELGIVGLVVVLWLMGAWFLDGFGITTRRRPSG